MSPAILAVMADEGNVWVCLTIGVTCIYVMQVILRESAPYVIYQRLALGGLSFAAFANALLYFPEYALWVGHRPTGVAMNLAVLMNIMIMAIRGRVVMKVNAALAEVVKGLMKGNIAKNDDTPHPNLLP